QLADLRAGKLVLSRNTKEYYLPLPDGTIIHAHPDDAVNLSIQVFAYAVIAF
ncbi:MAG TPA: two-component sensor histidine kinase, partial [Cupriavidus sp.]|nr:two-component sensor histidine kinase [Cupriavidus sp.]